MDPLRLCIMSGHLCIGKFHYVDDGEGRDRSAALEACSPLALYPWKIFRRCDHHVPGSDVLCAWHVGRRLTFRRKVEYGLPDEHRAYHAWLCELVFGCRTRERAQQIKSACHHRRLWYFLHCIFVGDWTLWQ